MGGIQKIIGGTKYLGSEAIFEHATRILTLCSWSFDGVKQLRNVQA